jgi:hypothetical protein
VATDWQLPAGLRGNSGAKPPLAVERVHFLFELIEVKIREIYATLEMREGFEGGYFKRELGVER